ncbi:MAG TPA: hypothetical protein VHF24_05260 [Acidimicrobiales bacterium]|nr:hypothetical protein [Acidimicrobiales bacterium]
MSELVIRAPVVRLLVPPRKATRTVDPPSSTRAASVATGAGSAGPLHLPEHDQDLDTRASLSRVSGWFIAQG